MKIIDYEEISSHVEVTPIERPVAMVPVEEFESVYMKNIIEELKIVKEEFKEQSIVIKNAKTE